MEEEKEKLTTKGVKANMETAMTTTVVVAMMAKIRAATRTDRYAGARIAGNVMPVNADYHCKNLTRRTKQ